MAKYIYITGKKGSEWTEEYNTLEEATTAAEYEVKHMCKADFESYEYIYILESANPDPDAPSHYDGNPVKVYKEMEG